METLEPALTKINQLSQQEDVKLEDVSSIFKTLDILKCEKQQLKASGAKQKIYFEFPSIVKEGLFRIDVNKI